jgi:RNA polymerase primary sigma factor
MVETSNVLARTARALEQEFGRPPTAEELAAKAELPLHQVRRAQRLVREPVSLDAPAGPEQDQRLGDFIADEGSPNPGQLAETAESNRDVAALLCQLTPREQKVLRMRFGIGERQSHTLEEIGQTFGLTRERIRQIEANALRKLKKLTPARALARD